MNHVWIPLTFVVIPILFDFRLLELLPVPGAVNDRIYQRVCSLSASVAFVDSFSKETEPSTMSLSVLLGMTSHFEQITLLLSAFRFDLFQKI